MRASRAGHCERALDYDMLGIAGDPITPRRAAVFRHGNILDRALKDDLAIVLGDRFLDLGKLPRNYCDIEGVRIGYEPDGAFQTDSGEIGIIEIKTMAEFSFDRALKGEIDPVYLAQAWVYFYGTSFNPVVFICYQKNASHFAEVVFDRSATDTVVTQRFGGNPQELLIKDPLLVAEIRTPFDPSVEDEVRQKFKRVAAVKTIDDFVPGVRAIEPETVKVQGAANAQAFQAANPKATLMSKAGSWMTFETGRKIAGYPCSYCRMIRICLGGKLEFEGGKPKWVIEGPEKVI